MTTTYNTREVAEILGVALKTVHAYRMSGKIPPPIPITDNGNLFWDEDAVQLMREHGPQGPGHYPIAPHIQARNTRPQQIQFRAHHLEMPLQERTLPDQNISATGKWIIEQYLELMSTLDAMPDNANTNENIARLLTTHYRTDLTRREEAQP